MLIVLFFAFDFDVNGITTKFPLVMRNICAIYSLLAIGYVAFRYISEVKGKKYKFVEYLLGNYVPEKKAKEKKAKLSKAEIKKNKELENGTLEEKPNKVQEPQIVEKVERKRIKDTDIGKQLNLQIQDLKRLLEAYQNGIIIENNKIN